MADPRDTRCISAAFDFLTTTEFCNNCINVSNISSDGSDNKQASTSTPKVKKSESDTALLECQQENLKNLEKLKVCLCGNRDIIQNLHNGELTEDESSTSRVVNGMADGQLINSEMAKENRVSEDDYSGADSSLADLNQEQSSCGDERNSCETTNENQEVVASVDAATNVVLPLESGIDEETEQVEVEMRPNRKSLHRRSTDTACISSAFGFLPTTDSVFISATEEASGNLAPDSQTQICQQLSASARKRLEPSVNPKNDTMNNSQVEDNASLASSSSQVHDLTNKAALSSIQSSELSPTRNSEVKIREGGQTEDQQRSSDVRDSKTSVSEDDGSSGVRLRRSRLSKQDSMTEDDGSGDSSDEDAGVYAESFRRSNWIRIDDDGQLELAFPAVDTSRLSSASRSSAASRSSDFSTSTSDTVDFPRTPSPKVTTDDPPVFPDKCPSPRMYISHKRSDSTSTTLSEKEFKREYEHRRKILIKRQNSSKEYHRYSAKVYDEEKSLLLEKKPEETDFGLHILDSEPAYVTKVNPGTAADRAGVEEGQILVAINGSNALTLSHDEIVALITNSSSVRIDVATSDFQPSRDLQASIIEGYMQKQGGASSIIRRWKKRYFVLRQDGCLYYYKQKDETDPLGAIPLVGYTFSRHLDSGRDYCFKAEKYGARTYYFMTENRDDMTEWVGALSEAAARSKKRKESFVSVSSHNVGLPALEVRRPECRGYLLKVGNRYKTWHRRYCVLKDACLYYYKTVNSLSALGVAHLHGYKVDPSVSIGKKHAFGVIPPDDTLRTFHFSAENDTDRQRWVDAMIRSIQRWVQIDNDC